VVREGDAAARKGRERTFLFLGRHVVRRLEEDFLVSLSLSLSLSLSSSSSSSVSLFVGERDPVVARSPVGDDPLPLPLPLPPPPLMVVRDTTEFAFVRTGNLLLSACLSEEPKYPYLELIAAAA